jgi:hypothetical protein
LLAILQPGEPLEAAYRAVQVSATAVRKRAAGDAVFAERLRAARDRCPRAHGWQDAAAFLEAEHPEHWSLVVFPDVDP